MSQSSNLNCSSHAAVYLLSHLFVAADFCINAALSRLLYGTCEPATQNTWKTIDDVISLFILMKMMGHLAGKQILLLAYLECFYCML